MRFEVAHPDFISPGPAPPGGPAVEVPGIPPFVKYAKDGAPGFEVNSMVGSRRKPASLPVLAAPADDASDAEQAGPEEDEA